MSLIVRYVYPTVPSNWCDLHYCPLTNTPPNSPVYQGSLYQVGDVGISIITIIFLICCIPAFLVLYESF